MVSKANKSSFISTRFLTPPSIKDFASCFSEHAVKVSDTSCSASSSGGSSTANCTLLDTTVFAASDGCNASVLTAVTCLYRTTLSTQKELLVRVTWSKSHVGPALSIAVDDEPSVHSWKPNAAMNCQLLRKKKGSRSYVSGSTVVGLHWDVSAAKYGSGPDPVEGFYVVITMNAEFGLLLGDMSKDYAGKLDDRIPTADFSLVSRKEQVVGHALHSTRVRFCDGGADHEVIVRCAALDGREAKENTELSVFIDNKRVVYVRRLRWNFRGNQTVFVDGSPVDMMWDVHDWLYSNPSGYAIFLLRTRKQLDSRLWLEEEEATARTDKAAGAGSGASGGFSLLIQAFKNT